MKEKENNRYSNSKDRQENLSANWVAAGEGVSLSDKIDLWKLRINIILHVKRTKSQESLGDVQIKLV